MTLFGCGGVGLEAVKGSPLELLSGSNLLSLLGFHVKVDVGADAGVEVDIGAGGGNDGGVRHPIESTNAGTRRTPGSGDVTTMA